MNNKSNNYTIQNKWIPSHVNKNCVAITVYKIRSQKLKRLRCTPHTTKMQQLPFAIVIRLITSSPGSTGDHHSAARLFFPVRPSDSTHLLHCWRRHHTFLSLSLLLCSSLHCPHLCNSQHHPFLFIFRFLFIPLLPMLCLSPQTNVPSMIQHKVNIVHRMTETWSMCHILNHSLAWWNSGFWFRWHWNIF